MTMAESKIIKIVTKLREKYANDKDAQDEISRAEETALYYEKRGEDDKAMNHIQALEDFLHDWY